jgi:spore coat protein H
MTRFTTRSPGRLTLASVALASLVFVGMQGAAQSQVGSADALLDGGALNDIWIRINARDWQDLHTHYLDDTYYPADVEWQGVTVRNAGIRVRGDTSRNGHKPSLRVAFNRYVGGQQFLGLDALVLNSVWLDPSMIRDRLSMLVFRAAGVPAPRQAHVRLFVGASREYAGVYAVSEEIDETFVATQLHDRGGYLFEFHRQNGDPYGFQDPGPDLRWYVPRFDPRTHQTESLASLYLPVRDLVEAVNRARSSALESDLAGYLDLKTFITMLAVQNFVAQTDGLVGGVGMNNFYLYRYAGTQRSVITPWDQDNSFSQDNIPPWWQMESNVLTVKVWNEPTYRTMYLSALLDVADIAASGWLEQEARRAYDQIRDAAHADPFAPYPQDRFEQDQASVQQFARERAGLVRQFVSDLQPELLAARRR